MVNNNKTLPLPVPCLAGRQAEGGENGANIRVIQELMGHTNVKTTEIYTHVMEKDLQDIFSPLYVIDGENNCA